MQVCDYELGVHGGTSVLPLLSGWSKTPLAKTSLVYGPKRKETGMVSRCRGLLSPGSTVVQPGGELSVAVEWLYLPLMASVGR